MKYLCLGYFNPQKMEAGPKSEIDAVMQECWSHMKEFNASGQVQFSATASDTSARLGRFVNARAFAANRGPST